MDIKYDFSISVIPLCPIEIYKAYLHLCSVLFLFAFLFVCLFVFNEVLEVLLFSGSGIICHQIIITSFFGVISCSSVIPVIN